MSDRQEFLVVINIAVIGLDTSHVGAFARLLHRTDDLSHKFPESFTDPSQFIATASLRSFEEIYRQADIHYRLHWAARNARHSGGQFPVSEGFIRERRKALDWVIGVEADWDEVPSDT